MGIADDVQGLAKRLVEPLRAWFVSWESYTGGAAFPGSPGTGVRFWRSDLGAEYYYNGTRWLTTAEYAVPLVLYLSAGAFSSATTLLFSPVRQTSSPGIYITSVSIITRVPTTNNGSNYWSLEFRNTAGTALYSWNTSTDTVGAFVPRLGTINSAQLTNYVYVQSVAKVGAPGDLQVYVTMNYRNIAT